MLFAVALAVGFGMYALWERSRSRRSAEQNPEVSISVQDLIVAGKAGLTPAQWQALSNAQRADLRWRIR